MEIVYERVAAIDVGKKEVAVTVRVPGQTRGIRTQQTRKFRTSYQVLRQMVGWLVDHGVTHVAMEATGGTGNPSCATRRLESSGGERTPPLVSRSWPVKRGWNGDPSASSPGFAPHGHP